MQDFLTAMKKRPLHLFFWDMNYYVCSPERYCSSYCGDLNWNTLFFSCPFVNSIFNEGSLAFIPLFWYLMVILPLFFVLCEFTPVIWNWRHSLPLLCQVLLTVSICSQKDHRVHVILPLLVFTICVFTPIKTEIVYIRYCPDIVR